TFTVHPGVVQIPEEVPNRFKEEMMAAVKAKTFKMPETFLSGLECMNNDTFREQFGNQVLSTDESLNVETISFLFTDIKGSTRMYSDLGDTRSYEIVRDHFKILFAKIVENGGVVVKTIGDAVMGSFLTPDKALIAAVQAHEEFKKRQWNDVGFLQIKMGIHSGNAIVVNMNNALDYFGNTVNTAARIQSAVEDHSIRFSSRVFADPAAMQFLKSRKATVRRRVESFKGIPEPVETYTFVP
ncbi:MAG: adenylate/guanylate cyclase domain-containing protein, partial [Spirochaetia bacterium]|nr:adenylate/guanylate cyclase domain-containing protein [Spirochaetia bacterium]